MKNLLQNILFILLILGMCACSPDNPPNSALDKGHESASRIVVSFLPGNLSEENIEGGVYAKGFTAHPGAVKQEFVLQEDEQHKITVKGKPILKTDLWYRMGIRFYNLSGTEITSQFTSSEVQRNMHQFFFQAYSEENSTEEIPNVLSYRYGDLQSDGSLFMPPIGFQGYIKMNSTSFSELYLRVVLVHLVPPLRKTDPKTGKPYPFDKPGRKLLAGVRDNDFRIPIVVKSK